MKKLLIANRGEIACRVIRTAREMGIRTVAVASDADARSVHANLADELVMIGEPEPSTSYLRMDTLVEAAREIGADAVHPGYGFLSERADFVDACTAAGITFVGPSGDAMRALGDKIRSKGLAEANNVPVTPGLFRPGATPEELLAASEEIGFPVMLKASAGGGGRGMRAVSSVEAFIPSLEVASAEALAAFGDGAMMVEKLVESPRHIEVQFVADGHGNVAVFYERECSIQRRHQKLIEEAPSVAMTDTMWESMRQSATRLALAAKYVGAGTVEFMLDPSTGEYYFLEVNARLQVEHPVSELITGVDLVALQILVARGESLADHVHPSILAGDRGAIHGHAIEARIVAEDASKGFMPSIGPLLGFAMPVGPGIRVDTGYAEGGEISRFYDSLVAKVIAHGSTREAARMRLIGALEDTHILGVRTNIPSILNILKDKDFQAGRFDTAYLSRHPRLLTDSGEHPAELANLVEHARTGGGSHETAGITAAQSSWALNDRFRSTD